MDVRVFLFLKTFYAILELSSQSDLEAPRTYNDTIAKCRISGEDNDQMISDGMHEAEKYLRSNNSFALKELHEECNCEIDSRGGFYFLVRCSSIDVYEAAPTIPFGLKFLSIRNFGESILRRNILGRLGGTLDTLLLEGGKLRYVTSKFFEGLVNLKRISLRGNHIHTLHINLFRHNPLVEEFDISHNLILSIQGLCNATRFWKNLKKLHMNDMRLKIGDHAFTHENSTLEFLDISQCELTKTGKNAFSSLISLKTLIVSMNALNLEGMVNLTQSLSNIPVKFVIMNYMTHLTGIPTKAFENLSNITHLEIRYGQYPILHEYAFPLLINLRTLDLRSNKIRSIHPKAFQRVPNLRELYLKENHLSSCAGLTSLPNLLTLDLKYNNFRLNDFELRKKQMVELVNLKEISFAYSKLQLKLLNGVFDGLFHLALLDLQHTGLSYIEEFVFHDLKYLTKLLLSFNSLLSLETNVFYGLNNLKYLYLSNNKNSLDFQDVNSFRYLQNIEYIDLEENHISVLPRNLFTELNFLEIVNLRYNLIETWNYPVFPREKQLRVVVLSNNKISSVSAQMLQEFSTLENLSLAGNPLKCMDCDVQKFQRWVIKNQAILIDPVKHNCESNNGEKKKFFNITISEAECSEDSAGYLYYLILIVVVAFIICTAFIWYKGRWYFSYIALQIRNSDPKEKFDERKFEFDAFISCSNEDSGWLMNEFLPNVEKKSIRLCIHQRDFTVGCPITDNIISSIEKSRKTVLIISKNYVKSVWCLLEAQLAQHTLKEGNRDDIVVVLLQDVPKKLIPNNLRRLLETKTYIVAPQNEIDHKTFWEQIIKSIEPNNL